jgi:hypothetical protein
MISVTFTLDHGCQFAGRHELGDLERLTGQFLGGLFLFEALVTLVTLVATELRAFALGTTGEAGERFAHLTFHSVLVQLTRSTCTGWGAALLLLHGAFHVHRAWLHDPLASTTFVGGRVLVRWLPVALHRKLDLAQGLQACKLLNVHTDGLRLYRTSGCGGCFGCRSWGFGCHSLHRCGFQGRRGRGFGCWRWGLGLLGALAGGVQVDLAEGLRAGHLFGAGLDHGILLDHWGGGRRRGCGGWRSGNDRRYGHRRRSHRCRLLLHHSRLLLRCGRNHQGNGLPLLALLYHLLALGLDLLVGAELLEQQVVEVARDLGVRVAFHLVALLFKELHHGVQPQVEFPSHLAQSYALIRRFAHAVRVSCGRWCVALFPCRRSVPLRSCFEFGTEDPYDLVDGLFFQIRSLGQFGRWYIEYRAGRVATDALELVDDPLIDLVREVIRCSRHPSLRRSRGTHRCRSPSGGLQA